MFQEHGVSLLLSTGDAIFFLRTFIQSSESFILCVLKDYIWEEK